MRSLIEYLDCGIILKHSENTVVLIVTKFRDIVQKIIPLFQQHPIKGVKALDFDPPTPIGLIFFNKKMSTIGVGGSD